MEYVIAVLVVCGFGYFVYTRVKASQARAEARKALPKAQYPSDPPKDFDEIRAPKID